MGQGDNAIEKRARDFAGYDMPSSQDIVTTARMSGKYEGFKAGAEWMFKKMTDFGKYDYVDWED